MSNSAWQKKPMIQGNFYERLHFYIDGCAISPTASLFLPSFYRPHGSREVRKCRYDGHGDNYENKDEKPVKRKILSKNVKDCDILFY